MPEVGFAEHKTAAYLAARLTAAGYAVTKEVGGTGVVGVLSAASPGPTLALRADMDALAFVIDGQDAAIHACGHDAHAAMVLTAAEAAVRRGLRQGTLKIVFQPAEEKLAGALRLIEAGILADIDMMVGIHLRPIQEAKLGQATPALYHGASYIMEAVITGTPAHGARPHLGVNAVDAAAAVVNAVNAIHVNPSIPATVKTTKLHAGGASLNAIPDRAELGFDLRAQDNALMEELIAKTTAAIQTGASTVGAEADVMIKGGVPAAEYDQNMIEAARQAIAAVLGPAGVLPPVVTPGGEDFHFFVKHKPSLKTVYIGLGVDLTPGLHHPQMRFDQDGLVHGVEILLQLVERFLGLQK